MPRTIIKKLQFSKDQAHYLSGMTLRDLQHKSAEKNKRWERFKHDAGFILGMIVVGAGFLALIALGNPMNH